jgi:hypothetical protein
MLRGKTLELLSVLPAQAFFKESNLPYDTLGFPSAGDAEKGASHRLRVTLRLWYTFTVFGGHLLTAGNDSFQILALLASGSRCFAINLR